MNGAAVQCYVIGILVQLPFVVSPLYTGPAARAMGEIDVSWIVSLAVTGPVYYWLASRSRARRAATA
jgi:nucleobase:cation symporter-1, NCS1 family